ncbi:hypothetical protein MRB53_034800 [Persea americana]|uniref:Uncharacterized protein n=1 Tax=Persea americana TaxID=3435 RepID=A0ACC2K2T9_PERAE|nr:hypothetical protein MRB53_034800 [Persea americana]
MAEAKQVPLNGAYYGPPIPPQQNNHPHRPRHHCCGPCCILTTLIKIIVTIIVILGIAALVLWLIYRPQSMKVYVSHASLTQFNLTNDNMLNYNLTVDISFRNPNKKIGFYYDKLEARAYYDGNRFHSVMLPSFYQGHKTTTDHKGVVFYGQKFIGLDGSDREDFNLEKAAGSFEIDVEIYTRMRFKIGSLKTNRYKPKFECELRLPLRNESSPVSVFGGTKCDVDF